MIARIRIRALLLLKPLEILNPYQRQTDSDRIMLQIDNDIISSVSWMALTISHHKHKVETTSIIQDCKICSLKIWLFTVYVYIYKNGIKFSRTPIKFKYQFFAIPQHNASLTEVEIKVLSYSGFYDSMNEWLYVDGYVVCSVF